MRDAAVPSRPLNARVIIGFGIALAILVAIGADSQVKQDDALRQMPVEFSRFVEAVRELGVFWGVLNEAPPGSVRKSP